MATDFTKLTVANNVTQYASTVYVDSAITGVGNTAKAYTDTAKAAVQATIPTQLSQLTNNIGAVVSSGGTVSIGDNLTVTGTTTLGTANVTTLTATNQTVANLHTAAVDGLSEVWSANSIKLNANEGSGSVILKANNLTFNDGTVQTTAYKDPTYVGVPSYSYGKAGDRAGMIAWDSFYLYVCTNTYTNGQAAIWKRMALSSW